MRGAKRSSHLYGIGVGPGDPDLMTLRAVNILRAVPVIAYPAPETGPSSARAIAAPHIHGDRIEIAIRVPMRPGNVPAGPYDEGARQIANELDRGRDVAILCEGDPLFYGSFIYLHERLSDAHDCTIVPAVTSLTACAAVARHPLVRRNEPLTVLPATLSDEALADRLDTTGAVVILKVGRHLARLKHLLKSRGLLEGSVLVEHATRADQRVRPLAGCPDAAVPYFSTILIAARTAVPE